MPDLIGTRNATPLCLTVRAADPKPHCEALASHQAWRTYLTRKNTWLCFPQQGYTASPNQPPQRNRIPPRRVGQHGVRSHLRPLFSSRLLERHSAAATQAEGAFPRCPTANWSLCAASPEAFRRRPGNIGAPQTRVSWATRNTSTYPESAATCTIGNRHSAVSGEWKLPSPPLIFCLASSRE